MFNGVVDDVTGSRVIPEIDMAAAQTGNNTSQHIGQLQDSNGHIHVFEVELLNDVVDDRSNRSRSTVSQKVQDVRVWGLVWAL